MTAFLFISEHLQKQEVGNIEENDEEKDFTVVDTYEEVKFYNKAESGYLLNEIQKAEQYGLIDTFEEKIVPVMGIKRNVQIHEAWSNNQDIYLLYSVTLLLPDKSPEDVPYLEVEQLTLHNHEESPVELNAEFYSTNGFENRTRYANDGFVFQDRFYRSIWIQPEVYDAYEEVLGWSGSEAANEHETFDHNLKRVENISLSMLHLVDGEKTHPIEKIPLEMKFMHEEKALETIEIDETIPLKEDSEAHVKRLEVHLGENRLYLDVKPDLERYYAFAFKFNGGEHESGLQFDENGETFLRVGEMNDHDEIRLEFVGGMIPSDEEFEYEITQQVISDFKHQQTTDSSFLDMHKELGKLSTGRSFKLIGIDFEDAREKYLKIFVEMETPWENYGPSWFRDYADVLVEKDNDRQPHEVDSHTYMEVTNSKGDLIQLSGIAGHANLNESSMDIAMETEDFMNSDGLKFRLFHFSKPIEFNSEEITISIPD
ncbi:hypothetical protein [Bacillus sp. Marseille-Q3570]|uniref:hypothetical protein n=1 Tax=Bacillus sp. Marseille-Q3570 TaxID=2963522 RepID=UPI0021B82443|nr:hypothetical protein [Bacillus sp. Marseille-Q3570]